MTLRRELLSNWVRLKHLGQFIKRTNEPYYNHLENVAAMASSATPLGYEIGICHDLFEDTSTTEAELRATLIILGYPNDEVEQIIFAVVELTDVFTSSNYPQTRKRVRKEQGMTRLITISPTAQTIKYCDLIDNIHWVLKYDQKHAVEYLHKKERLLQLMNQGDTILYQKTVDAIQDALKSLT